METHTRLSLTQETFLKKQLLNIAIQREVDQVFVHNKDVQETIFLKFIHDKLLDFPLWGTRTDARAKCKELLTELPKLLKHSQKATKRDVKNKGTRQVVSKCFDMALRTKQQKQDDLQKQELDISCRLGDQDKAISSGAQLSAAGQAILGKYDYSAIFGIIQEHSTSATLPSQFQTFIKKLVHTLAIWIDAELQDPSMVKKLKTVQFLTPTLAIRAVLAISNPVKLMQNILSLLLARPFGSWNLMQKLFAVMVDTTKTEKLLKSSHKNVDACLATQGVNSATRKKIIASVRHLAKENRSSKDGIEDILKPEEVIAKLLNTSLPMSEGNQQLLNNRETAASVYDYFMLVGRLKEKIEFIELLGNEQMLEILRELLPVIYTPMAQLFSRARVGTHFHILFKTLKRIIKASESPSSGPKRYVGVLERFIAEFYSFLHESAVNDDHSIGDALHWLVLLLAFSKEETIDLDVLLTQLDETTFSYLVTELDQVVDFYEYRAKLKQFEEEEDESSEDDNPPANHKTHATNTPKSIHSQPGSIPTTEASNTATRQTIDIPAVPRPDLVYIPLLVEDFVSMVKSQLGHLETSTSSATTNISTTQVVEKLEVGSSTTYAGTSHQ